MVFLAPFIQNEGVVDRSYYGGSSAGDERRDFLREVERNLRLNFDWSGGPRGAERSLSRIVHTDDDQLVAVVDFALRNIELGYGLYAEADAARALERALTEAGSVWTVATGPQGYNLRRRITAAGDTLARQAHSPAGNASSELQRAYNAAYGRDPDPSAAYRHAVKAVEAAAIPVVSPSNSKATLGTLIGDIRQKPQRFSAILGRPARRIGPSADDLTPVEVTMALIDQLWHNQTDRHSPGDTTPATSVTQPQAEWAVHTAGLLVQVFRAGWIT